MNLNEAVDAVLDGLYRKGKNGVCASDLIREAGMTYEYPSSKIIYDKLKSLPYYDQIGIAGNGSSDLLLTQNASGFEFIQQHRSYSQYMQASSVAERESKRIAAQGARGSFWSGIGAVVAIPLSLASFVYTCQKDQKQERNIETISDSLHTTVKRLMEAEQSIRRLTKVPPNIDSSAGARRK